MTTVGGGLNVLNSA